MPAAQLLRHVVLFKFHEQTRPNEIQAIVDAFGQLGTSLPLVESFEWGLNNSPEGLNQGFTHCFLLTFRSEQERDAYLPHPAHQKFVEMLRPHLEKAMVVDYWAS